MPPKVCTSSPAIIVHFTSWSCRCFTFIWSLKWVLETKARRACQEHLCKLVQGNVMIYLQSWRRRVSRKQLYPAQHSSEQYSLKLFEISWCWAHSVWHSYILLSFDLFASCQKIILLNFENFQKQFLFHNLNFNQCQAAANVGSKRQPGLLEAAKLR